MKGLLVEPGGHQQTFSCISLRGISFCAHIELPFTSAVKKLCSLAAAFLDMSHEPSLWGGYALVVSLASYWQLLQGNKCLQRSW